jgi:tRNA(adenine34) deaminase
MIKKEFFMQKALKQAAVALKYGEVPIGAVVVDAQGVILGRAFNKVETVHAQSAHAEILAIARACKRIGDWRLNGCWLYVTLEPCLMCLGLIQLSRIEGVVFGAKSHLFGSRLHMGQQLPTYAKHLKIEGGVKEAESIALLKSFFKDVRKKRKDSCETACGVYSENKKSVT